jgi:nicotinamide mononucleotide transporter
VLIIGTVISQLHTLLPQIFQKPASFPYIDTFVAACSVLAVILLARRIFETWVLWILVDVTSIWLYFVKGVKTDRGRICDIPFTRSSRRP